MRPGVLVDRRDAHQPLHGKSVDITAAPDECDRLTRVDAGFLRFRARVHLHIKARCLALPADLSRNGGCDLLAVDRLHNVEKRHGLFCLVGLQRSDQMKFQIRKFRLQRRPFALRLLHTVLAEDAVAGLDDRTDRFGREGLRDDDK